MTAAEELGYLRHIYAEADGDLTLAKMSVCQYQEMVEFARKELAKRQAWVESSDGSGREQGGKGDGMTQLPMLFDAVPAPKRKRGHVPRTSVLAYESVNIQARESWCLSFLRGHMGEPWTSAEIASNYLGEGLERLLFVRRGLSDLKAKGFVEHVPSGDRVCRVTGRKSVCWRLKTR